VGASTDWRKREKKKEKEGRKEEAERYTYKLVQD